MDYGTLGMIIGMGIMLIAVFTVSIIRTVKKNKRIQKEQEEALETNRKALESEKNSKKFIRKEKARLKYEKQRSMYRNFAASKKENEKE
jgi:hypothetical protein